MANEIVARIEQVSGHTHDLIYDLVFTADRMVVAVIEHPSDVPYRPNLMDFLIGARAAQRDEQARRKKIAEDRRVMYRQMTPDELAAAHKSSFEVPFDTITFVKITQGFFDCRLHVGLCRPGSREVTIHFGVPKSTISHVRDVVNKVLGPKLREKG